MSIASINKKIDNTTFYNFNEEYQLNNFLSQMKNYDIILYSGTENDTIYQTLLRYNKEINTVYDKQKLMLLTESVSLSELVQANKQYKKIYAAEQIENYLHKCIITLRAGQPTKELFSKLNSTMIEHEYFNKRSLNILLNILKYLEPVQPKRKSEKKEIIMFAAIICVFLIVFKTLF
jgi:hypothetical protein